MSRICVNNRPPPL